ncbi:ring-opening amidohydrolase [Siccirubricoccus sp. KC 17139]|uniref:Cyanuric acid amidohydrolase n=1 Tax=Siccirubricoccus soli TaxID=2899147 RepID=A0ABT1D807_9PROT|nr:ring-opening amidohydrolase [Siccirubricoccus soli]MCO6418058.1 ring-opening amidohydrolase [Siccirubricoccus soli]MCP2684193.1 ring-opening amidohydrolase [Siccirubricoccus soli]
MPNAMSRRTALVHRVPARHPGDAAAVAALFDSGAMRPEEVVAILGKTEGNGCVNDFTRAYAVEALSWMLAARLGSTPEAVQARVALVMSGGTEGGLSPHFLVFGVREATAPSGPPALALGTGFTPELPPEALGRLAQVRATAAAVREAMDQAGIADPADVHYVQVKCPLLTNERIAAAKARGATVSTEDTYHSMGLSRGASALGVALALGEVAEAVLEEAAIGADWSLFSGRASCSAGIELLRGEVVVMGNSPAWGGDLAIAHAVMQDAIDLPAVQQALRGAGLAPGGGQLPPAEAARLVAVLAKAEPASTGRIRGRRHIMWDDSDINATRHARALVGGVIAAAVGRTDLFVSGGAEHQGPDGGGPVAVIARRGV